MTKKTFISIFLICSMVLLCSCEENINNERTKIFSNYLQHTFQKSLPNEKTVFFVITSNGCPACKVSLLKYVQNQTMNFKLIIVQDWKMDFPVNVDILYDEDAVINRLNMKIAGTYVLFIKNKEIVDVFSVTPLNIPLLDKKVKKFIDYTSIEKNPVILILQSKEWRKPFF